MKWEEISNSEKYQALPEDQQRAAQEKYFNSFIAPKVQDPRQLEPIRTRFLEVAGSAKNDAIHNSADEDGPGYFSNAVRLAGERATDLAGNLSTFVSQTGNYLEDKLPLGGFVFEEGKLPRYATPDEYKRLSTGGMTDLPAAAGDKLREVDLGGDHRHTPDTVKSKWNDRNYLSATGEAAKFAGETFIQSSADMVGLLTSLPVYISSFATELGQERAKNKGKEKADITDTVETLPFAIGSALLDRIVPGELLGAMSKAAKGKAAQVVGDEAAKAILPRIAAEAGKGATKEALTEAFQEGVLEYTATRYGTDAEMSVAEALETGAWAALAGSLGGSAMGGATGAFTGSKLSSDANTSTIEHSQKALKDLDDELTQESGILLSEESELEAEVSKADQEIKGLNDVLDRFTEFRAAQAKAKADAEAKNKPITGLNKVLAESRVKAESENDFDLADEVARLEEIVAQDQKQADIEAAYQQRDSQLPGEPDPVVEAVDRAQPPSMQYLASKVRDKTPVMRDRLEETQTRREVDAINEAAPANPAMAQAFEAATRSQEVIEETPQLSVEIEKPAKDNQPAAPQTENATQTKKPLSETTTGSSSSNKAPWEMTKKEWDRERDAVRPNTAQSKFTNASKSEAVSSHQRLTELLYGVSNQASEKLRAAMDGEITLTPRELEDITDRLNTPVRHRDVVEKALSEGKPVPGDVLREYGLDIEAQPHSNNTVEQDPSREPTAENLSLDTKATSDNLPPILTQSKRAYLNQQAKEKGIKKGSPGYEDAMSRLESDYETEVDRAQAALPFEEYNKLNSDSPESVNRQAYEALREEFGVNENTAATELEDFGEKLGGARKDEIRETFSKEITDDDYVKLPLNKIWPKDLHESIEDINVAAFMHSIRSLIPRKPLKRGRQQWANNLKESRKLIQQVIEDPKNLQKMLDKMSNIRGLSDSAAKIKLLAQLDRSEWNRIGWVRDQRGTKKRTENGWVPYPHYKLEIDGSVERVEGDTLDPDKVKELLAKSQGKKENKSATFEIRGRGAKWSIYKKGDSEYRPLTDPMPLDKAREYLENNGSELNEAWEQVKERDNVKKTDVRSKTNRLRVGGDYRNEKDVTPEMFSEAFGFRGVEFGNWVKQGKNGKERQGLLNQAYDALHDLAKIIGIPPKAISLNGELGLGLGSRGRGGNAAAHYEPGNIVINLTKTQGAGALAHEWFHALDNYFSRARGENASTNRESRYVTYRPEPLMVQKGGRTRAITAVELKRRHEHYPDSGFYDPSNWEVDPAHPEGVRPVVEKAFAELVEALNKSPMSRRALTADKNKQDRYWSQIIERAARSFESYIIAKMDQAGYQNDFLANVIGPEGFSRDPGRYPYLLPEEMAPVESAFENLFDTIETKETDKGIALYQLGTGKGVKAASVKLRLNKLAKEIAVPIKVVQSVSELPKAQLDQVKDDGVVGRVRGLFDTDSGTAYVIADNLNSVEDAAKVYLHEVVGHKGLRAATGKRLNLTLSGVYKGMHPRTIGRLREKYEAQLEGKPEHEQKRIIADEYVAELAESDPQNNVVQRVIAAVRRWLRSILPSLEWTDADIVDLIRAGKEKLKKGTEAKSGDGLRYTSDEEQSNERNRRSTGQSEPQENVSTTLTGREVDNAWREATRIRSKRTGKPLQVFRGSATGLKPENFNELGANTGRPTASLGVFFSTAESEASSYGAVESFNLDIRKPKLYRVEDLPSLDSAGAYQKLAKDLQKQGYDGIIISAKHLGGPTHVVAFNPDQVIIGKPKSRYSLIEDSDVSYFAHPEERKVYGIPVDAVVRKLADKMRPLKLVQKKINESAGQERLPENLDAYMAEEAFHGKTENDLRNLKETYIEPLVEHMAKTGITREELDIFLWANHARERNAQVAKINPEMPDGGSGMSDEDAAKVIHKAHKEGKLKSLHSAAQYVYKMLGERRNKIAESLADEDMIDAWDESYKYYVPLKGYAHDETNKNYPRIGKGFDIRGKESLRALGRRSAPESPLLHAIKDTTETFIRYRKNQVGNVFLDLVEQYPNPSYWQVFTADSPELERRLFKSKDGENVRETPVIDKSQYFITKRNGVEHYIKLADDNLLRAMKNMGPEPMNGFMRFMAGTSRFLSSVNTSYNPEFMVTNAARDIQTAVINLMAEQNLHDGRAKGKNLAGKMVKGVPSAVRAIHASLYNKKLKGEHWQEWQKAFDDFREDGAKTGWFDMKDIDGQAKELESMLSMATGTARGRLLKTKKVVGDFVEHINAAVENGVRLSVYKNAVEAGVSRKQAASLAKNLTVNFNRKGEIGQTLNALYMFANASIQGTATFARAIGTLKIDENGKKKLNNAQKLAIGITGAAIGLAVLNRSIAGDDDDGENWYDKVPDYVKERNIVIMKSLWGGEPGAYMKIPLPYGYNMFHVLGTSFEAMAADPKTIGKQAANTAKAAFGAFSPIGLAQSETVAGALSRSATPTLFKPVVDLAANENFFGSQIYRENYPFGTPKPESHLTRRSTNENFKTVSQFLNQVTGGSEYRPGFIDINPDKLSYIFDYFTGSAGAFVNRTGDAASKLARGETLEDRQIPFYRQVSGNVLPYADQNSFYERKDEIDQINRELRSLKGAERFRFRKENSEKLKLRQFANTTGKRLTRLRKRRDAIEADKDLTPKERQEKLDEIQDRMKVVVDRFNKRWPD